LEFNGRSPTHCCLTPADWPKTAKADKLPVVTETAELLPVAASMRLDLGLCGFLAVGRAAAGFVQTTDLEHLGAGPKLKKN
jgi:hypothetical protein